MLTIDKCRKTLEVTNEEFTDDEIQALRDFLYMLAEIEIKNIQKDQQNEKSNSIRPCLNGRTGKNRK